MKNKALIAIAVLVLLAAAAYKKPGNESYVYFYSGGKNASLKVIVADTDESRNKGLMFVNKLGENEGMLFVYYDEQKRTLWMKNTLIPLDMIFIAANGTVIGVVENAEPCENDPCATYSAGAPARFVIETNAGFAKINNIAPGGVHVKIS